LSDPTVTVNDEDYNTKTGEKINKPFNPVASLLSAFSNGIGEIAKGSEEIIGGILDSIIPEDPKVASSRLGVPQEILDARREDTIIATRNDKRSTPTGSIDSIPGLDLKVNIDQSNSHKDPKPNTQNASRSPVVYLKSPTSVPTSNDL